MSLKLVHDDSVNIEKLDVYNFQDIAGCARRFADQLETDEEGPRPSRVVVILDTPEGIALCVWGENANGYEMVGILESAKLRAHEAQVLGDD